MSDDIKAEIPELSDQKKNLRASLLQSLLSFFGAIVLILVLRWVVAEPYVIPSGSMLPTLLIHDHILVNKMAYGVRVPFTKKWLWRFSGPRRGEVVVFRSVDDDSFFMVKRVVGVAGDRIGMDEQGHLMVNGEKVFTRVLENPEIDHGQDPYYRVSPNDINGPFEQYEFVEEKLGERPHRGLLSRSTYRWPQEEIVVPRGEIFLMGDNRDNSRDSRVWGALPVENLLGRASLVWLSCTETLVSSPFICDPTKIRWQRFFHLIE